ncbi:Dolichyldiphosphatase [Nakaseomyces bracarensis]|uniref:Dolichyldiphosphatase n=1 Tax=Nakaseomyces bracarensis TaxID=273131 RepID=A0ABR4NUX4_9SACH
MNVTTNANIIPFDDTYILYDPEDFLSFLSAYFSLLPILILTFYLSWFIITRELEACIIALGQLSNEIMNNIVKNIVKQDRPYWVGDSFQENSIRSGYGMPSAHSQFMGFTLAYFTLSLIVVPLNTNRIRSKFESIALVAVLSLLSASVTFSRVYLHYHSVEQVLVGFTLGMFNGSAYLLAVRIVRNLGIWDWMINLPIARILYMKDTFNLFPVTLKQEYTSYWNKKNDGKVLKNS